MALNGAEWWARLDSTFQGAIDLPADERAAFLDRACGADAALRDEVEAMLAADAPQHALGIERLVHDSAGLPPDPDPFIGMRLGPWQVVDLVGHGGMGSVYLAERADGQYEQRVALKVVRGPAAQPPAFPRFKSETYILARLSHPNIARVIDAGHTPEGSPYLVMEYVDGSPVTTHCDDERLTVNGRLSLFQRVCAATQHAHQALVVHRDLKPSNILVTRSGEVKLLDFGIAKLLEPDLPPAERTRPELRALTPAYAAPEQIRGEPVTTATDVYVLGAVLYELLTGERPAAHEAIGSGHETHRIPPPSAAVRRRLADTNSGAGDCLAVAAARRTSPERLIRRFAGDVDRVVLKALQQEPNRRYGSAGQLADDIERLLDGRPVAAQPDTFAYRARRFVARHRLIVTAGALTCALLVTFATIAIRQARAAAIERDRARVEARRAERVSVLVTDLFKLAEPAAGRGDTIAARELLDQASHRIGMELQGDPETQAALFNALARVYGNLGLHDSAIAVLQRALDVETGAGNQSSLARAGTLHLLGERQTSKNDYEAAESRFRAALALRRNLNAPALDVAATLDAFGRMLSVTGRYADARTLMEESVEIRRRQPGVPDSDLMSGLHEFGLLLHRSGDIERAERLFREAAEIGRRIPGPSPPKVTSLLHLAEVVAQFDDEPLKATPLLREALEMARSIYPGDHQQVALCLAELARNQFALGRLTEAEAIAREAAAMAHRLYGDRHNETLAVRRSLSDVLRAQRKWKEAEEVLADALVDSRALLGDGNPATLLTSRALASVLEEGQRFDEALTLRKEELTRTIAALGERDVFVAIGMTGLGQHGLKSGRMDIAEHYFLRALEVRRQIHSPDHWRIDEARGMVGLARLRAGRLAAAETDLLSAYEGLKAHRGPDARETAAVRTRLVELYDRWNRPADASQYRDPH
jgi:serine/threonine-protein kinase